MIQMNEAQQQAVLHMDGPMLVLAGPGSGKTLVITERIRYLIKERNIPQEQLLVITFTKAAANEMKDRFLQREKSSRSGVNFGTFHAVFFTILKSAYRLTSANIIKDEIRLHYMKEIIHQLNLEYEDEKEFISDLFSEISLVKGNRMDLSNYYSVHCADEVFRTIYAEYDKRLQKAGMIDFDDMLLLCHRLLTERKDILAGWQERFRYILVDEFQDINMLQYEIVQMLARPRNNLFVVGDDDQSIYRFRGAKPEIMLNFRNDYPDYQSICLNRNYRSCSNILEGANRLIRNNKNRYEKAITADKDKGSDIVIRGFETLSLENQSLCEEIMQMMKQGVSVGDIAILVRTVAGSGALVRKLMEYNIPFRVKDSLPNLYDHWIATDIIAYIKIAMGNTDRRLYFQIMNRPKRYLSRESFDSPEVDWEAVKDYYEDKNWMSDRLEQFEYDIALLDRMSPYAAVNYIRKGIGYEDFLKEYAVQRRINTEELIDILDELQENSREFKTYEEWFSHMEDYKEELKRQAVELRSNGTDCVTVSTMHSAKGLEYRAVFIVDAIEGITPHKKAVLEEDIEEERRLFYVAMTRAKEQLYIYSAKERYNRVAARSRFIDELSVQEVS